MLWLAPQDPLKHMRTGVKVGLLAHSSATAASASEGGEGGEGVMVGLCTAADSKLLGGLTPAIYFW